jgi:hypothetical protein
MRFLILLAILTILRSTVAHAQRTLNIGDSLPDLQWSAIHAQNGKLETRNWKGKSLLIHIYSPSCPVDQRLTAKLNELQAGHSKDLSIVQVSRNNQRQLESAETKYPILRSNRLPTAFLDSTLHRILDFKTVGHLVWIDSGGKIAAITTGDYATEKHIRQFIEQRNLNWPEDWQDRNFNYNIPFLKASREPSVGQPYWRSVFPFQNGLSASLVLDSSTGWKRITIINIPLFSLYAGAFSGEFNFRWRNLMEIDDRLLPRLFENHDTLPTPEWKRKNAFGYEAVVPAGWTEQKMNQARKEDLNSFLGLNVHLEARRISCWVIRANIRPVPGRKQLSSNGSMSLDMVLDRWNAIPTNPPLVSDLTEEELGAIRITRDSTWTPEKLKQEFKNSGLRLNKGERNIQVLVFE